MRRAFDRLDEVRCRSLKPLNLFLGMPPEMRRCHWLTDGSSGVVQGEHLAYAMVLPRLGRIAMVQLRTINKTLHPKEGLKILHVMLSAVAASGVVSDTPIGHLRASP